ncbi:serine protease inhibitor ecotin [Chryseobacterium sp. Ch-15]|uniref:Serine protease inhibitor ecotin n=1 Tax=Chryseobacterium muglaense TaxID=2893752 RepID=A0A9Q3UYV2_9FLAO|nr:serine protease inhibitor ecotin [Chryseobacterium muglaense]MBD3905363.1 serine protease inhibitor ecotin [Chryseobacterium muglaense]MCC9036912.1 serine protease inhibitor ecotin [Chryseobacterium muglaense]MCM2555226.1 serine protease inhibitor ecotin [Chryseobacterium muglaense]
MKFLKVVSAVLMMFVVGNVSAQKKKAEKFEKLQIEMFPKAKEGYKQVYIQLPIAKNENDLKVEFFVGVEKMLDCNNHFLMGKVATQDLQGWGYNYYEVESNGETGGTLMACPDQKKTKKFVSLQPEIVRYNSKLPLVFYVPKDLEVRYRVLRPDATMKKATQK